MICKIVGKGITAFLLRHISEPKEAQQTKIDEKESEQPENQWDGTKKTKMTISIPYAPCMEYVPTVGFKIW